MEVKLVSKGLSIPWNKYAKSALLTEPTLTLMSGPFQRVILCTLLQLLME